MTTISNERDQDQNRAPDLITGIGRLVPKQRTPQTPRRQVENTSSPPKTQERIAPRERKGSLLLTGKKGRKQRRRTTSTNTETCTTPSRQMKITDVFRHQNKQTKEEVEKEHVLNENRKEDQNKCYGQI